MEKKLFPNDLAGIYGEIHEATTKWEKIGLGLNVPPSTLERIKTDFAGKSEDQLQEMLKEWLNLSTNPTRQELANVLRSVTVGLPRLAVQLEDKHRREAETVTDGQSSSGPQPSPTHPTMKASGENSRSRSEEPVPKKCKVARPEDNITFVNPVPEALQCVQCNYVAIESQQLPCGRLLCKYCNEDVSRCPVPECPDCGEDALNTVPDARSKKEINRLEVECNGCEWRGKLKELDEHLSTCPQKILCPYSSETDCRAGFPNKDLHYHLTEYQEQHLRGALNTIKKLKSTTTELQTHVNELSTKLNKEMEAHETALATIQALKSTTIGLQTQVSELTIKLKAVEESQECCQPQTPPLILQIREFRNELEALKQSDKDQTESWYTPPFYTHNRGYKMRLCISATVKARHCRKITFSIEPLPGRYDSDLPMTSNKAEVMAILLHPRAHAYQPRTAATVDYYPLEIPQFSFLKCYENSRNYMTINDSTDTALINKQSSTEVIKGKERSICIEDYCKTGDLYIQVSAVKFTDQGSFTLLHLLMPTFERKKHPQL